MRKIITILFVFASTGIFAQNYKFGKVSKEELAEKIHPLDSTASAAYLYKFRKTHYDYTGSDGFIVVTEHHERIKVYSKEGFYKATKEIRFYKPDKGASEKIKSIKAYTYNLVNGKVVKERLPSKSIFQEKKSKYYSVKKITMPNIKEGSIIEITYKTSSPYARLIDDVKYQFEIPVKKLNVIMELPEFYKFNKLNKGYFSISPLVKIKKRSVDFRVDHKVAVGQSAGNHGSTNTYEFNSEVSKYIAENIPALKNDEQYVSNIDNYRGGIKYELTTVQFPNSVPTLYASSWDKVALEIYSNPSFGGELNKSGYYKDDLATVLASANNELEKIAGIYQFVKNKVKWNGYFGKYSDVGVRKAYKEGVGNSADINLMLTSMLRSAGLNANPVLVSTRRNGVPLFPTINGFNYLISIVTVGDGYVLLDATEKYGVPNVLPVRALNWNGRIVKKDGSSSWIRLESSSPAIEDHTVSAKITDELMVEGMLRSKFSNLSALNFRNRYNVLKEEEVSSKLEEDYSIEIENFRIGNKFSLGKPVSQMVKFSSEDLIEEISNKIYINPMLFFTMSQNPFKAEDRKFPVDFNSPWKRKYTISIQIPEGYTVETLPVPFAVGMSENRNVFKYQLKQTGSKITVVCTIQFNESKINPNNYKELKEFFRKMVEKQTEKIVLTKN